MRTRFWSSIVLVVAVVVIVWAIWGCSGPRANPVLRSTEVGVSVGDGDIAGRGGGVSEADVDMQTFWVSVHPFAGIGQGTPKSARPVTEPAPTAPEPLEEAAEPTPEAEPQTWWETADGVDAFLVALVTAITAVAAVFGVSRVRRRTKGRSKK